MSNTQVWAENKTDLNINRSRLVDMVMGSIILDHKLLMKATLKILSTPKLLVSQKKFKKIQDMIN